MFNIFGARGSEKTHKKISKSTLNAYNKLRLKEHQKYICLAPFNSLRINRNGGITPCCQNYHLDNLDDKTLDDVWFGDTFKKLRRQIKNKSLGDFCDFCAVHLQNNDFGNVLALSYDFHKINKNAYPSYMDFTLDNTCNLSCVMCNGALSSKKDINRAIAKKQKNLFDDHFFHELKAFLPHLGAVNFSGGEPFLIDTYYKIWDLIFEVNPHLKISCTTNGTILNERVKSYLTQGRFNINVSIDSLQKETYETIRLNALYDNTMSNIDFFKSYCTEKDTTFSFVICPMRMNSHELPEFIEYGNKNQVYINFNTLIRPYDCAIWTLSAPEIEKIYTRLNSYTPNNQGVFEKFNAQKYLSVVALVKTWLTQAIIADRLIMQTDLKQAKLIFRKQFSEMIENFISQNDKWLTSQQIDASVLVSKTNDIINNLPENLLIYDVFNKLNKLPKDFIINEIYFEDTQTTIDNLCAIIYFEAMQMNG